MEVEFNSYNFGITYKELGYLDMSDVDALISEKNLDAANSAKVALLYKLHPVRQKGKNVNNIYQHIACSRAPNDISINVSYMCTLTEHLEAALSNLFYCNFNVIYRRTN